MDQATLVGPDVQVGFEALSALDTARIKPSVAALILFPEYEDWRFVLAASSLDQTHSLNAYDSVAAAFGGRFVRSLPVFMVLPLKDPFIRELRRLFAKAKDVTGMRLGGQTIGNRFVSSGYVYRVA